MSNYDGMYFTFETQKKFLAGLLSKFGYKKMAMRVLLEKSEKVVNSYAKFLITHSDAKLDMEVKHALQFYCFKL